MPGSPPTSTAAPLTSPPPSTRSNSDRPVGWRGISRDSTSARLRTGASPANEAHRSAHGLGSTDSRKEFNSQHGAHLPSHFGYEDAHSQHSKTDWALDHTDCLRHLLHGPGPRYNPPLLPANTPRTDTKHVE